MRMPYVAGNELNLLYQSRIISFDIDTYVFKKGSKRFMLWGNQIDKQLILILSIFSAPYQLLNFPHHPSNKSLLTDLTDSPHSNRPSRCLHVSSELHTILCLFLDCFIKNPIYQFHTIMGGSQSVEIPGGGTEGYHVLRVSPNSLNFIDKSNSLFILSTSSTDGYLQFFSLLFSGPKRLTRLESRPRGIFRLYRRHREYATRSGQ